MIYTATRVCSKSSNGKQSRKFNALGLHQTDLCKAIVLLPSENTSRRALEAKMESLIARVAVPHPPVVAACTALREVCAAALGGD